MKILSIILVFAASSSFAEVYTWSDTRGARHYTNRPDEIPVRYRARAKSLNYGAESQTVAPSPQRIDQVQPVTPAELPAARHTGGNPVQHINPPHSPDSGMKELRQQREERRQEKMKARAGGTSKNPD